MSPNAAVLDARELSHVAVERREVVECKVRKVVVPARAREHLHEFDSGAQEPVQAVGGLVDREACPQMWLLRRDARPGSCSVWHARMPKHPIAWMALFAMAMASAPRLSALAKSAASRRPPVTISVTSRRLRRSRWLRARASAGIVGTEMLSRNKSGAAPVASAATVENDVVDADFQRGVDIVLDVLRRQLHADRNSAAALAHLVGEVPEVVDAVPVREASAATLPVFLRGGRAPRRCGPSLSVRANGRRFRSLRPVRA